ncbi:hypothetical protein BB559_005104 [Furculomyces boomerangus]|uniref:Autophagy protein 5 n=1 Tax=Furculomyces boomerangus TaxID=61424 RepID=A0A2T9YAW9_9FUNG|nr:hypothetical protein BB559_005104 [Furculomyces boomerangus]
MARGQVGQEIEKRLCEGAIPLRLTLDPTDSVELMATPTLPKPFQSYYILGPRASYFPFLYKQIKEEWLFPILMQEYIGTGRFKDGNLRETNWEQEFKIRENEIWLEYNGAPLKWHYPIGLLYDIEVLGLGRSKKKEGKEGVIDKAIKEYRETDPIRESEKSGIEGNKRVPWDLVLHLRKFPSDKLIKSPSTILLKDIYMSMLKEADYVRNGSSKRVMDMSKSDQIGFLVGIEKMKVSAFQTVRRLQGDSGIDWAVVASASQDNKTGLSMSGFGADKLPETVPKAVPIRCYVIRESKGKGYTDDDGFLVLQAPISVFVSQEEQKSKLKAFGLEPQTLKLEWTTTRRAVFSILEENGLLDQNEEEMGKSWVCLTQGIRVPWEAPILWASDNLGYADNFLHLHSCKENSINKEQEYMALVRLLVNVPTWTIHHNPETRKLPEDAPDLSEYRNPPGQNHPLRRSENKERTQPEGNSSTTTLLTSTPESSLQVSS